MSSSESSADSPPTKILPCLALAFLGSIFLLFMMWSFEAKTLNKPKVINHTRQFFLSTSGWKCLKILFFTNSKHFSGVDILTTYFSSRTGKVFHHLNACCLLYSSLCYLNVITWNQVSSVSTMVTSFATTIKKDFARVQCRAIENVFSTEPHNTTVK